MAVSVKRYVAVALFVVFAASLLPVTEAVAHQTLPVKRYNYYYVGTYGLTYGYKYITLKPDHKYKWNGDRGGTYRHKAGSHRIRFTTGPLSRIDELTAFHEIIEGAPRIRLHYVTPSGSTDEWYYPQGGP